MGLDELVCGAAVAASLRANDSQHGQNEEQIDKAQENLQTIKSGPNLANPCQSHKGLGGRAESERCLTDTAMGKPGKTQKLDFWKKPCFEKCLDDGIAGRTKLLLLASIAQCGRECPVTVAKGKQNVIKQVLEESLQTLAQDQNV